MTTSPAASTFHYPVCKQCDRECHEGTYWHWFNVHGGKSTVTHSEAAITTESRKLYREWEQYNISDTLLADVNWAIATQRGKYRRSPAKVPTKIYQSKTTISIYNETLELINKLKFESEEPMATPDIVKKVFEYFIDKHR